MSDVFISIRNQNGNALTSVGGIPFVANLKQDGQILAQQVVDLRFATAHFYDLPLGQYITSVRHELVSPQEANQDVTLSVDELIQVVFVYLELERILLRIRTRFIPLE